MKRRFLQTMTWRHIENGQEFTKSYHFKTAESAIKDANKWMNKLAQELNREIIAVSVTDKETGDVIWSWEA